MPSCLRPSTTCGYNSIEIVKLIECHRCFPFSRVCMVRAFELHYVLHESRHQILLFSLCYGYQFFIENDLNFLSLHSLAKSTRAVAGPKPKPVLRSSSLAILKKVQLFTFCLRIISKSLSSKPQVLLLMQKIYKLSCLIFLNFVC